MIKKANIEDIDVLVSLAVQLWSDNHLEKLEKEFYQFINNKDAVFFLKYIDNRPVAFAQCQLRHDYVEGTNSSPVGYLEGIFVVEEYRHKGYATELLKECEKWAKEKGCTEFASDCELDNHDSFRFHIALGFEETNRIICFKKEL